MSSRTVIVGDVHGNYEEACDLLEACAVGGGDRVIFVGDLVDRGPRSDSCLDLAISLERSQAAPSCVMGNHEEQHLTYRDAELAGKPLHVKSAVHDLTRSQLRAEHYDFMRSMPTHIELPDHDAIVVHAGMYPGRTIGKQSRYHLLHAVMIAPWRSDGAPSQEERSMWPGQPAPVTDLEWKHWTHFWGGPELIVFGHIYTDVPIVAGRAIGLDGGCCFGGELRALILPDMRIVSVKAAEPSRGQHVRRSTGRLVKTFEIHPGVLAFS